MLKKLDGFILGLIGMIILAKIYPEIGKSDQWYGLDTLSSLGISLIFFFYGLKLSPKEMMKGVTNYRLHLVIQLSTFLLFPLIIILFKPLIQSEEGKLLWMAMFFMAALPSTVSSSVVMVVLAKGNTPGAIFNASISGLLGIIITPLWMSLFLQNSNFAIDFSDTFTSLLAKILAPVILGLMLNKYWGTFAKKHSKKLSLFDKSIILCIVYNSFSNSFSSGIFSTISIAHLLTVALSIFAIFAIIYVSIKKTCALLEFNREDEITAVFCGSKKSLVHGSVMAKVLFTNSASLGIFLLPTMVYHAMQLIIISFIAQKKGKEIVG